MEKLPALQNPTINEMIEWIPTACSILDTTISTAEARDVEATAGGYVNALKKLKDIDAWRKMKMIQEMAVRTIGKLIEKQRRTVGLAKPKGSNQYEHREGRLPDPPTLEEAGINKWLATKARAYARIPDDEFKSDLKAAINMPVPTSVEVYRKNREAENYYNSSYKLDKNTFQQRMENRIDPLPSPKDTPLIALSRVLMTLEGTNRELLDIIKRFKVDDFPEKTRNAAYEETKRVAKAIQAFEKMLRTKTPKLSLVKEA